MTFDWFRRRFDDKKTEDPRSAETEQPPAEPEQPAAEESGESAEAYLNWAKLAYENIRKRQQAEAAAAPATTPETTPEAAPEAETSPEPEPDSVEAPVTEAPVAEAPVAEAPVVEAPVVEAPTLEAPVVEAPVVEAPVVEAPPIAAPPIAEPDDRPAVVEADSAAIAPLPPEPPTAEPELVEAETPVAAPVEAPVEAPIESEPIAASDGVTSTAIGEPEPPAIGEPEPPETAVPETTVPETAVPETAVPEAAVPEAAVPEAAVPETAVPETTIPEVAPPEAAPPETAVPETAVPEAAIPEALPEPVAPLPFWAAAEAERQARLEQLRQTAIQEPEPEPVTTSTPTAEPEAPAIPDFVLDESFLWSAEVLAAQGRRPDQISIEEINWLSRLRQGLDKTRRGLVNQLRAIVGQGPLNQAAVMEIEAALLQSDVGIAATDTIIEALQQKLRDETLPPEAAIQYLKTLIRDMLDAPLGEYGNLTFVPEKGKLNIWLMTGVNGAGKTTTIGKLAHIAKKSGYNCLIAAADTFRAAAVEQVKVWGARSNVEVIANPGKNTDPAAVVFDAITAAQSRNADLLLVDTAGRLQNKKNLMDELSKVRRIIDKKAPDAVVESLLVLDSTLGQNGLRQAEVFSDAAKLSGVVLTKLDGTAKGGIALAVVQQLGLPIRFIGAGEGIEDLRPFSSYEFVEALLNG